MTNLSEVKDPNDLSPEEIQEQADILREEILETPPSGDPNAFDVIGGAASETTEVVGDIDSLSLNEKYALILHQAKQTGPLFFAQVSPDTFKLPDNDPLNLIWINIMTGWRIASNILADFEIRVMNVERELSESTAEESSTTESSPSSSE